MRKSMAIVLLVVGCSQVPPPALEPGISAPIVVSLEALEADSIAEEQIRLLFRSESSLIEPDSFFADGAIVLADGELRGSAPRLAGVGVGGTLQLVSTRVSTSGGFVWAILEYRWLPMFESDPVGFGLATLVFGRDRSGAWKLMHMHSSSARPVQEKERPGPPDPQGDPGRGGV
jgi:hypothetical protein